MIIISLDDGTGEIEAGVAKRWDDLMPSKIKNIKFNENPYVIAFLNLFKYKKDDIRFDIPFIGILKLKKLRKSNMITYHILNVIKSYKKDTQKIIKNL